MKSQLYRILISRALSGFILWYGVEKLFQQSLGITPLGTSLLAVAYIIVSFVFNVPTGVLADKFGRKYAVFLSFVFLLFSSVIGYLSHSFIAYGLSAIFWGLFYTTQSGAYEALLYDTLKSQNREREYSRWEGISSAVFWGTIFVGVTVGAWAGKTLDPRTTYLLTVIPNVIGGLTALWLVEPPAARAARTKTDGRFATEGIRYFRNSVKLQKLAGYFCLLSAFGWISNEFAQLFFIELHYLVFMVGFLGGAIGALQSFGAVFSHRFTRSPYRLFVGLSLVFFCLAMVSPSTLPHLASFLLFLFVPVRMIGLVLTKSEIQHGIPSEIRATALSTLNMITEAILLVLYLVFGFVSEHYSVRTGFLVVGTISAAVFLGFVTTRGHEVSKIKQPA